TENDKTHLKLIALGQSINISIIDLTSNRKSLILPKKQILSDFVSTDIAFDGDHKLFISAISTNGKGRIFEASLETKKIVNDWSPNAFLPERLAFGNNLLAVADKKIALFDLNGSSAILRNVFKGHLNKISSLEMSEDGKLIISSSSHMKEHEAMLWSAESRSTEPFSILQCTFPINLAILKNAENPKIKNDEKKSLTSLTVNEDGSASLFWLNFKNGFVQKRSNPIFKLKLSKGRIVFGDLFDRKVVLLTKNGSFFSVEKFVFEKIKLENGQIAKRKRNNFGQNLR
ncbi:hypothetical protein MHBO_003473, partial [Bonamia ostreae]